MDAVGRCPSPPLGGEKGVRCRALVGMGGLVGPVVGACARLLPLLRRFCRVADGFFELCCEVVCSVQIINSLTL